MQLVRHQLEVLQSLKLIGTRKFLNQLVHVVDAGFSRVVYLREQRHREDVHELHEVCDLVVREFQHVRLLGPDAKFSQLYTERINVETVQVAKRGDNALVGMFTAFRPTESIGQFRRLNLATGAAGVAK